MSSDFVKITSNYTRAEELTYLYDLVDFCNAHVHCCYDDLGNTWSRDAKEHAYSLLQGNELGVSVIIFYRYSGRGRMRSVSTVLNKCY